MVNFHMSSCIDQSGESGSQGFAQAGLLAFSFVRLRKDYILHTRTSVARSCAITTAGPSRKRLKNFVQQGRSE
jgi:hypothetical protein